LEIRDLKENPAKLRGDSRARREKMELREYQVWMASGAFPVTTDSMVSKERKALQAGWARMARMVMTAAKGWMAERDILDLMEVPVPKDIQDFLVSLA